PAVAGIAYRRPQVHARGRTAFGIRALAEDMNFALGGVDALELERALERRARRPKLHVHLAVVMRGIDLLGDLRPGHALGHAFYIAQQPPSGGGGRGDRKGFLELHFHTTLLPPLLLPPALVTACPTRAYGWFSTRCTRYAAFPCRSRPNARTHRRRRCSSTEYRRRAGTRPHPWRRSGDAATW